MNLKSITEGASSHFSSVNHWCVKLSCLDLKATGRAAPLPTKWSFILVAGSHLGKINLPECLGCKVRRGSRDCGSPVFPRDTEEEVCMRTGASAREGLVLISGNSRASPWGSCWPGREQGPWWHEEHGPILLPMVVIYQTCITCQALTILTSRGLLSSGKSREANRRINVCTAYQREPAEGHAMNPWSGPCCQAVPLPSCATGQPVGAFGPEICIWTMDL